MLVSLTTNPKRSAKVYLSNSYDVCILMIQQPRQQRILNSSLSCFQGGAIGSHRCRRKGQRYSMAEAERRIFGHPAPQTSSVLTKYLIRRVEWKYIRLRQLSCVFRSTLVGSTLIVCIVIM